MWITRSRPRPFPLPAWLFVGGLIAMLAMPRLHAGPVTSSDPLAPGEPSAAVLELLERDKLPEGVVFEIIENDRAALSALLPEIRASVARLRERDPDYPVAVVSHGAEQFTLTRREATQHPSLHDEVEALVRDEGVNVAVCGTFAGWRGLDAEAFADFVEVADRAPDRLDDYRELGFEVIRLRPSLLDAPPEDPWEFDFGTP
ncbi:MULTISPECIES: DsrE family protein [unclassified Thioalkalivibrio]|uniref:DsrE family protein n=1 Tax=unclassified Thioalkalivibrio TaxID=2621013 RepID=UPI000367C4DA|nr:MULTISPECIES: DsrE family protein [unclassified Thioalkalivibrio]